MHFDGVITLGTLLEIISMVVIVAVAWNKLSSQLAVFANTLDSHAKALADHASRLDRHEDRMITVVSDLQRIIGRSEVLAASIRVEDNQSQKDLRR